MDHIQNKRAHNDRLEYQIYWFGYTEPTWEPAEIIQIDCPQLVFCYERSLLILLQLYRNYAENAHNHVLNVNEAAAQQVAVMYQQCRQLEADCRSKDERLQRAMKNRHLRGRFECYLCHKEYNRKDRMFGHIRERHLYGKKVSAVCGICKKPLSNSYALRRHMQTQHTVPNF